MSVTSVIDNISERLGVSRWVVWVGIVGLVVTLFILYRRARGGGSGASNPNSAGDVLNGPWSHGADGTSANTMPTSPDGGADDGHTSSPRVQNWLPPHTGPGSSPTGPRRVTTVVLPSDMTWPQIAQTYTGSSGNAQWLLGWNQQLHSQPWWTVAKGTRVNVPRE